MAFVVVCECASCLKCLILIISIMWASRPTSNESALWIMIRSNFLLDYQPQQPMLLSQCTSVLCFQLAFGLQKPQHVCWGLSLFQGDCIVRWSAQLMQETKHFSAMHDEGGGGGTGEREKHHAVENIGRRICWKYRIIIIIKIIAMIRQWLWPYTVNTHAGECIHLVGSVYKTTQICPRLCTSLLFQIYIFCFVYRVWTDTFKNWSL